MVSTEAGDVTVHLPREHAAAGLRPPKPTVSAGDSLVLTPSTPGSLQTTETKEVSWMRHVRCHSGEIWGTLL